MNLSETLKYLRTSIGVPQSQIAKAAGISTTQYQNYEYGKSEPTATVLIALAEFFEVTIDYLLGLTDDPLIPDEHVYPIFAGRIRDLRANKGLSEWDMEKLFDVTARNYAGYEIGESMPQLPVLCALADYFDVSLDYLVGRSDDPERR